MKLNVYDRKNQERLLGTLDVNREYRGDYFSLAIMPRMSFNYHSPPLDEIKYHKADFRKEWRNEVLGRTHWTEVVNRWTVLTTDAPLSVLMQIPDFAVDGEEHLKFDPYF